MQSRYDGNLVLLSFAIAFAGAYASIVACDQLRTCKMGITKSRFFPANTYILIMAACLGGIGIWCMHFIGMSAVTMTGIGQTSVQVRYDTGLSLLALVLVLLFTGAGGYISAQDLCFAKHKREIVDLFTNSAECRNMKMSDAAKMSHFNIVWLISTRAPLHLLIGGMITGSGVIIMHYIGVISMHFQGHVEWHSGIIAASCLIAFLASIVAFWIQFRLLALYPNKEALRIMCALVMAGAVCGMHYTGMAAATFVHEPHKHLHAPGTMSKESSFIAGLIIAASLAFVCMALALADLRYSVRKLSTELMKADDLIKHLNLPTTSATGQSVVRYISKRKLNSFSAGILNDMITTQHLLAEELSEQTSTNSERTRVMISGSAHGDHNGTAGLSLLDVLHRFSTSAWRYESSAQVQPEAVTSGHNSVVDEMECMPRAFTEEIA